MKTLKECNSSELLELYHKNRQFAEAINSAALEESLEAQAEEARLMGASDVFKYNDYYSSFYYSTPVKYGVKEGRAVAGSLNGDYLTQENANTYKQLCELVAELEKAEDRQDEGACDLLENKINEKSDILAEGITKQLRAFEDITPDMISEQLDGIQEGWGFSAYLGDAETDGERVYQHITKIME